MVIACGMVVRGEWLGALVPTTGAVALLLAAFATSLDVRDGRLVARNLGLCRSVPLADVQVVTMTHRGLCCGRYDHGPVVALAVRGSWLATVRGRPSRADRVVEELRQLQADLR